MKSVRRLLDHNSLWRTLVQKGVVQAGVVGITERPKLIICYALVWTHVVFYRSVFPVCWSWCVRPCTCISNIIIV